jgi:nitrogen regulatory protein P-II 1
MKKIEAIIKPFKLDALKEELVDIGVDGVTITEVRGVHPSTAKASLGKFEPDYLPRMKIEIVVPNEQINDIIRILQKVTGNTQSPGEEILVMPIDQSVRVRTSENERKRKC